MTIAEANYPFDVGIKQLCAQKGMKQKYLAEQIGCSEQALCDIMAGRRLIKACEIPRFAKVLGVTIDQIEAAGLLLMLLVFPMTSLRFYKCIDKNPITMIIEKYWRVNSEKLNLF